MINEKYILLNMTLEEYNKKYRNRRHRLLKHTKKEVETFDNKYKTHDFLLKDRVWYLIGDTYYEKPIAPRFTWFRNLSATAQAITCALAGGAVASAVVVPSVIFNNGGSINPGEDGKIVIDSTDVNFTGGKQQDGSFVAKITPKIGEDKGVIESIEVTLGTYKLNKDEYKFSEFTGNLSISKEVMNLHKGKVTIKPIVKELPKTDGYIQFDALDTETCEISLITAKASEAPSILRLPSVNPDGTLKVTKIKDTAKFGSAKIKKIFIPKGITYIGNNAFQCTAGNRNLENVEFETESQCETISKNAFYNQIINSIVIPKSVKTIGENAFSVNDSDVTGTLTSLKFEEESALKNLGQQCFRAQKLCGTITLPNELETIELGAFYKCDNPSGFSIKFNDDSKLSVINASSFEKSTLKEIKLPKTIKSIWNKCFAECKLLEKLDFSEASELEDLGKCITSGCDKINLLDLSSCVKLTKSTKPDKDYDYWLEGGFTELRLPSTFNKFDFYAVNNDNLKILDLSLYDDETKAISIVYDSSKCVFTAALKMEKIYVKNDTIRNLFITDYYWKKTFGDSTIQTICVVKE